MLRQPLPKTPVIIFGVLVLMVMASRLSFDQSTDFMAFIATRPLATLPLGAGDIAAVLQGGTTKRLPAPTYAQVNASNTWTKSNAVTSTALSPGTTVAVDASLSNGFTLLVSNNGTVLSNPTNITAGQELDFLLTVGAGGFSGFSTGSSYKFAGGAAPTWSTVAAKADALHCKAWSTAFIECAAAIDVR